MKFTHVLCLPLILALNTGCFPYHIDRAGKLISGFDQNADVLTEYKLKFDEYQSRCNSLSNMLETLNQAEEMIHSRRTDASNRLKNNQSRLIAIRKELEEIERPPVQYGQYRRVATDELLFLGRDLRKVGKYEAASQVYLELYERRGGSVEGCLALLRAGQCFVKLRKNSSVFWVVTRLNQMQSLNSDLREGLRLLMSALPHDYAKRSQQLQSEASQLRKDSMQQKKELKSLHDQKLKNDETSKEASRNRSEAEQEMKSFQRNIETCLSNVRYFIRQGRRTAGELAPYEFVMDPAMRDKAIDTRSRLLQKLNEAEQIIEE